MPILQSEVPWGDVRRAAFWLDAGPLSDRRYAEMAVITMATVDRARRLAREAGRGRGNGYRGRTVAKVDPLPFFG